LRIRFFGAVLFILFGIGAWSQPNEKRFTLRGRAVDFQTGQPLANLRITLDDVTWKRVAEPILTGPDGRFVFRGLENHPFVLGTTYHGETIHYRERPDTTWTRTVMPNDDGSEIEFRVASHPSVSGTVLDEFGDPLSGVAVALFHPLWMNGQMIYMQVNSTSTDDRGRYRLRNIWPGSAFLCAGEPNESSVGRRFAPAPPGVVDFMSSRQSRVYRRTCYPGSPPSMLQLAAGENASADLVMTSVPGLTLSGNVSNLPHGYPPTVASLRRDDFSGERDQARQIPLSDGRLRFDAVQPGRYILTVNTSSRNGDMPMVARQAIEVKDTDLEGIALTLEPMGAIEVVVHRMDTTAAGPNDIQIELRPVGQTESYSATTDPGGSRRFAQLDPGAYWVSTRTTAPYCVQSIRFGPSGEEVLQRTLTVTPGMSARLDVTLTTECGTIEGHVVAGGKPVPLARVIVLLSGTAESPGDIFESSAEFEGEFSVTLMPPGRYLIWAWNEGRGFFGPTSLADVADKASVVVVGRGQKGTVVVRPLNPEGENK
jgi:hypothetical protein